MYNAASPSGVNDAFQTAGWDWGFLETQSQILQNAVQGIYLSLLLAFGILILSTFNFIISFFSVLAIGCIIVSVLAMINILNW